MHKHIKEKFFQELGQLYSLSCDSKTVDLDLKGTFG